jgi:alpha-tubulin suppressor-like RCC1 family protein
LFSELNKDSGMFRTRSLALALFLVVSGLVIQAPTVNADPAGMPAAVRAEAQRLSVGRTTACLVASSKVYCWGNGGDSRIGTPSDTTVESPRLVADGPTDATAVAVGKDHACALRATGQVFCFGRNIYGQLGSDMVSTTSNTLASPIDFTQIVAGDDYTCGLSTSSGVMCWGLNAGGLLGGVLGVDKAITPSSAIPLIISMGADTAVSLAAGSAHICALLASTKVKCWGNNSTGQLGDGHGNNTNDSPSTPDSMGRVPHHVLTSGSDQYNASTHLSGVTAISAGLSHSCVVLSSGEGRCWGAGSFGQLGGGVASSVNLWPVVVRETSGGSPLTDLKGVSAGDGNSCFVRQSGVVACAGDNTYGQIGNSTAGVSHEQVPVNVTSTASGMNDVVSVGVGTDFACALTSTGRAYCWGRGDNGQIGSGGTLLTNTAPTAIAGGASQTISVTVPTTKAISDAPFTVSGTSTSGGTVSFASITTNVCTVSGVTVTLVNIGTCTVRASSGATGVYVAAADVDSSITVSAAQPQVSTGSVTSLTVTSATLTGVVNARGASTTPTFVYGTSATLASGTTSVAVAVVTGVIDTTATTSLTSLLSGVTYYYRLDATNALGSTSSDIKSFTTKGTAPTVTTGAATADTTTATLVGEVNANEVDATVSFEYGTNPTLAGAESAPVATAVTGTTASAVSASISKLAPGTTYFFRVVAVNVVGTSRGDIKSFATKGTAPTVATGSAVPDAFGATVAAEVNANGVDTTVSVEYGTNATLVGAETAAAALAVTGSTTKTESVSITKLTPGTTYFFRVVAVNAVGTSRGDIKSFTTKGAKPTVTTGSATRGTSGMTVNGKVNARDLETSVRFDYGLNAKLVGAQQTVARSQTGAEDADITAVISGLAENTTYYYRIVAVNVLGTTEGEIRSFTTLRSEGVSINDGEEFTSSQEVVVSLVGPSTAVKAILSNDGGFKTSETFDLVNNAAEVKWKLQSSREGTFTKIVYVKYVTRFGSQLQAVTDDIILDTTKPVVAAATAAVAAPTGSAVQVARVSSAKAPKKSGGVRLSLRGSDTISGIGKIEVRSAANKPTSSITVSRVAGKADGKPRAASQTVTLRTSAKRLQVRVIDRAGNASAWRTIVVK